MSEYDGFSNTFVAFSYKSIAAGLRMQASESINVEVIESNMDSLKNVAQTSYLMNITDINGIKATFYKKTKSYN